MKAKKKAHCRWEKRGRIWEKYSLQQAIRPMQVFRQARRKNQSQQHNAHIAEQVVGDGGQCSGSVSQFAVGTAGYGTHMGDGTIHCQEEERGDSTGISDLLYHGGTLSYAPIVDVHGYDKAKVQGSNGIHGLVAAQEALKHRGLGVDPNGFPIPGRGSQYTADKYHSNEEQQAG